jgi:DNA-binding CsgD family transcriptional regulator
MDWTERPECAIAYLLFPSGDDAVRLHEAAMRAAGAGAIVVAVSEPSSLRTLHAMSREASPEVASLTAREREILESLGGGYRYKEIADRHFISLDTVRTHVRNIYLKPRVTSRTEALLKVRGTAVEFTTAVPPHPAPAPPSHAAAAPQAPAARPDSTARTPR